MVEPSGTNAHGGERGRHGRGLCVKPVRTESELEAMSSRQVTKIKSED